MDLAKTANHAIITSIHDSHIKQNTLKPILIVMEQPDIKGLISLGIFGIFIPEIKEVHNPCRLIRSI